MADPVAMPLSSPIMAHGESLLSITLRAPTVRELRAAGAPYHVSRDGGAILDYEACARLLSAVCAIPPSSVDQLAAGDFDEAAWRIVGFMRRSSEDESSATVPPQ